MFDFATSTPCNDKIRGPKTGQFLPEPTADPTISTISTGKLSARYHNGLIPSCGICSINWPLQSSYSSGHAGACWVMSHHCEKGVGNSGRIWEVLGILLWMVLLQRGKTLVRIQLQLPRMSRSSVPTVIDIWLLPGIRCGCALTSSSWVNILSSRGMCRIRLDTFECVWRVFTGDYGGGRRVCLIFWRLVGVYMVVCDVFWELYIC